MQRLRNPSLYLFFLIFLTFTTAILVAQNDELTNIGQGTSQTIIYELVPFTFNYPDNWRVIEINAIPNDGAALSLIETDDLGLESQTALLTLSLVEAERAIEALEIDAAYTSPVANFVNPPQALVLDDRDAAIATVILANDRDSVLLTLQVGPNLFVLLQAISNGANLEEQRDTIIAIAESLLATLPETEPTPTNSPIPIPTIPPRDCPYKASISIKRLRVINSEEAGTGLDYNFDGDQTILTLALGPILNNNIVDPGSEDEFLIEWTASLRGGDVRNDIGELVRDICNDEFGLFLRLVEDDSTPFGEILTPLGEIFVLPLVSSGQAIQYPSELGQRFIGESQDGAYEYEVILGIQVLEQEDITEADLTPTATPSLTFTPTITPTASSTAQPSSTFTLTPTDTLTPSSTPTYTSTPTITATPTITPTPTHTFTPTITPTPSDTLTPSITPTPSNTPTASNTPIPSDTSTATHTATATHTLTATLTPSETFTPSSTPTATNTPTETLTPSATFTPSLTPTPTPVQCRGAQESRLYSGMTARVVPLGGSNRMRSQPTLNSDRLGSIPEAATFEVLDGPVCADGFAWFQVNFLGTIAWTAEGDFEDYWLEPLPEDTVIDDDQCIVIADGIVNQRTGPGTSYDAVSQLSAGETRVVVGKATSTSSFVWWKLEDNTWVREDTVNVRGICSTVPDANR